MPVDGQVVVAAPVGMAEGYFEFALLFRVHADHYFAVPGVVGLLLDLDFIVFQGDSRFASNEEVKEDGVFFFGVDVAADRGHEAGLVRGTAGAAEPFPSVKIGMLMPFAHVVPGFAGLGVEGQKLVVVEEGSSVEGDAGKAVVVGDLFKDVRVFGFACKSEHAVAEEGVRDAGAGLVANMGSGKDVVALEAFVAEVRSGAARYVHFAFADAAPEFFAGFEEAKVSGLPGDVGHAAVKVERPDGVADGFVLLPYWFVDLVVILVALPKVGVAAALSFFQGEVERFLASFIEEVERLVEILLVAGGLVELDQGQLDLLVAGVAVHLVFLWPEGLADVVGVTAEAIQEISFAGRVVVGDGRFHKMPGAVKLVVVP